jgi:hypothetical protein
MRPLQPAATGNTASIWKLLSEASISCKVHFHSASPIALRRSGPIQGDADTMQNQGCTTSMAWLPWVMAALQVGCPSALKGVFCTADSAPVAGFRAKPDTVWPRKFDV